MTKCVKVLQSKQSMDQSQARIKPFRACDWSMLCFARNTLTHFVIAPPHLKVGKLPEKGAAADATVHVDPGLHQQLLAKISRAFALEEDGTSGERQLAGVVSHGDALAPGAYTRPLFSSTRAVSDTKCTQSTPYPQNTSKTPLKQSTNEPPIPQKAHTLSRKLDECKPLPRT